MNLLDVVILLIIFHLLRDLFDGLGGVLLPQHVVPVRYLGLLGDLIAGGVLFVEGRNFQAF